jgi:hypothetical protein
MPRRLDRTRRSMRYRDQHGRPQDLTAEQAIYLDTAGQGFSRGWGGLKATLTVRLLAQRDLITLTEYRFTRPGEPRWTVTGRTKRGDQVMEAWKAAP